MRTMGQRHFLIFLTFFRGVHNGWNRSGAGVGFNQLGGLQAVHSWHHMIHENDVGLTTFQKTERGFGAVDRIGLDINFTQQTLQHHAG